MSDDKLSSELAEMKARLDQLTTGRRSEFEEALLKGFREKFARRNWEWEMEPWRALWEENPALTAKLAEAIVAYVVVARERAHEADKMRAQYCDMRAALEVMLQRLPLVQDTRSPPTIHP